jgi:hypothetical protein
MIHEIILNFNSVFQVHEETLCTPNDLPTVRLELKKRSSLQLFLHNFVTYEHYKCRVLKA